MGDLRLAVDPSTTFTNDRTEFCTVSIVDPSNTRL